MRKLMIAALAASALIPAAAGAQSAREAVGAQKEVDEGVAEVAEDVAKGDMEEAREDMQEVREDAKEAREDWMDYRKENPTVFDLPDYVGPTGYTYNPVSVGYIFTPDYRVENYLVSNYATYRLPPPIKGEHYIRYGNDVALVDDDTGRVVKVYPSFFR